MKQLRSLIAVGTGLCLVVFAVGFMAGTYRATRTSTAHHLISDQYKVLRIPGGMLEVSTLVKQESFSWQTSWTCPAEMCATLPSSTSQISADAHYTYRVPLSAYWVLEKIDGPSLRYRLQMPKVQPLLPVSINLATVRVVNTGSVFAPNGPTQQKMQEYMQPQLARRATSAAYIQAQEDTATRTIKEFAKKWMRDAGDRTLDGAEIEVNF